MAAAAAAVAAAPVAYTLIFNVGEYYYHSLQAILLLKSLATFCLKWNIDISHH